MIVTTNEYPKYWQRPFNNLFYRVNEPGGHPRYAYSVNDTVWYPSGEYYSEADLLRSQDTPRNYGRQVRRVFLTEKGLA